MAIWGSVLKKMDENTMILIFGEFGSSVYIFCDQVLMFLLSYYFSKIDVKSITLTPFKDT